MFEFLAFFLLLLIGRPNFSFANDCPPDVCAKDQPTVGDYGEILMTVYYDNDDPNDSQQLNSNMVGKACGASGTFGDEMFDIDFVVGAGSRRGDNNELIGKNNVEADRRDGCAAKLSNDPVKFNNYTCCKSKGGSERDCVQELGVSEEAINTCVDNRESDELLMANGDRRRDAGIPGCHVPEFAFNGVVDRCMTTKPLEELIMAVCQIYNRANILC